MYNSSITHPASITLTKENHSKTNSYDIHPASIVITRRRRQTNKRKNKRKMNKRRINHTIKRSMFYKK